MWSSIYNFTYGHKCTVVQWNQVRIETFIHFIDKLTMFSFMSNNMVVLYHRTFILTSLVSIPGTAYNSGSFHSYLIQYNEITILKEYSILQLYLVKWPSFVIYVVIMHVEWIRDTHYKHTDTKITWYSALHVFIMWRHTKCNTTEANCHQKISGKPAITVNNGQDQTSLLLKMLIYLERLSYVLCIFTIIVHVVKFCNTF